MMERQFAKSNDSIEAVFDYISKFAEAHSVNPDIMRELQFAAEEVFTNMIKYNTESKNDLTVGLCLEDGEVRISITDHDVHSFDPTQRPPVDISQPAHERSPGGLGIHLIRQMMDDVIYEYQNQTAKITLIRKLER